MTITILWNALAQLYDLNCEITETERRQDAIRRTSGLSAVSYSPDGASGRTNAISRPTEKQAVNNTMLTLAIDQLLAAQREAKAWLVLVVGSVPDARIRRMLMFHYHDGLTWDQVAERMQGHILGSSARDGCKRYLADNMDVLNIPPVPKILSKPE